MTDDEYKLFCEFGEAPVLDDVACEVEVLRAKVADHRDRETNNELLARHARVLAAYRNAVRKRDRAKPGAARDRLSRRAGCYNFTVLTIEGEMRERGLCD